MVGDQLGLYRALADGPQTADELAAATGCQLRPVRESLGAQVVSGYCEHDPIPPSAGPSRRELVGLGTEGSPTTLTGDRFAAPAPPAA